MKVVITGGLGFLGRTLGTRLAARGRLCGRELDGLVLADALVPGAAAVPAGAKAVELDVGDGERVSALLGDGADAVFHLASIVSGEGEANFDGALRVNLDGTRHVLEACRALGTKPRLVYASSIAVFGGSEAPETVSDETRPTPRTTYGTTKALGELLVNDYTRKGFLDGRTARLPTVIVRPGRPNAAASSFASAVVREPLAGTDYVLPVPLETRIPVIGARTAVECLLQLAELDGDELGDDRALNLPSLAVTVAELLASLRRVAGGRPLGAVSVEPDPAIEAIVRTWPLRATFERALALGLARDASVDEIVRAYLEDYASGRA
jgi:nucleoside-diphosphate-sugar epimerase